VTIKKENIKTFIILNLQNFDKICTKSFS